MTCASFFTMGCHWLVEKGWALYSRKVIEAVTVNANDGETPSLLYSFKLMSLYMLGSPTT